MIIDQFNVFSDNVAVTATGNSNAVQLMPYMGRGEQQYITVLVKTAYSAGATVSVGLQECDTATGTFTDVASGFTLPSPTKAGSLLIFSLPANTAKPFLRLKYTVTGTPAAGNLFAFIGPEQFAPYSAGQFVDAGKVVA